MWWREGGDGDGGGGGGGGGEQAEGREENDAAGVNEAAVGADAVEAQDEQEAAVGREVRTEQKEAVVEDGELYIGASELWRRRQVQIVPGREQVDAVAEEKRGAPQADDKERDTSGSTCCCDPSRRGDSTSTIDGSYQSACCNGGTASELNICAACGLAFRCTTAVAKQPL